MKVKSTPREETGETDSDVENIWKIHSGVIKHTGGTTSLCAYLRSPRAADFWHCRLNSLSDSSIRMPQTYAEICRIRSENLPTSSRILNTTAGIMPRSRSILKKKEALCAQNH